MKKATSANQLKSSASPRPALTPEARENQLICLAIDRAEEQLRNGTASSQVITHYLKLGSSTARLEREILEKNKALIDAKTQAMQSTQRIEELYKNAMDAFKRYKGEGDPSDY